MGGRQQNHCVTDLDKIIAPFLVEVLVDLIRQGEPPIRNGELLRRARARNPDDADLGGAVVVGLNHRLLVISKVTRELGFPNITSFVVGQDGVEVGSGYPQDTLPAQERKRALQLNWPEEAVHAILNAIADLEVGSQLA